MASLFIVVYRDRDKWKLRSDGIFTERRVADNYAEIARINDYSPKYEFFVVECPVPGTLAADPEPQFEPFPTTQAPEPYPEGSVGAIAPGIVQP